MTFENSVSEKTRVMWEGYHVERAQHLHTVCDNSRQETNTENPIIANS